MVVALALLVLGGTARSALGKEAGVDYDAVEVSAVFNQFTNAVAGGDGDSAARLVGRDTLEFFEQIRDYALTGSRDRLEGLFSGDHLPAGGDGAMPYFVFGMCRYFTATEVKDHGAAWLFARWVERGLLIRNAWAAQLTLEPAVAPRIADHPNIYVAKLPAANESMAFVREDNQWKLRLSAILATEEAALSAAHWVRAESVEDREALARAGARESKLIYALGFDGAEQSPDMKHATFTQMTEKILEILFGEPASANIFKPMVAWDHD